MSANHEFDDLERALQDLLRAPEPSRGFRSGTRTRLLSRAGELTVSEESAGKAPRRLLIPILAVVCFLLVGLMIAPRSVLAGLMNLLGYRPDVGLVEVDQNLRFLIVPSPLEESGLTLTFENGYTDAEGTNLVFRVDGFGQQADGRAPEACSGSPTLLSGTDSFGIQKGQILDQWETGYRYRYSFPTLPADANEITLRIPCLLALGSGPVLKDLEIPLRFSAEEDPQLMPVVEIQSSPSPEGAVPAGDSTNLEGEGNPGEKAIQFELILDQALQWEEGTLLKGHLAWQDERLDVWDVIPTGVSIQDADGQALRFEESYQYIDSFQPGSGQVPWAYFIPGLDHHLPFKISFQEIRVSLPADEAFTLDLGPDPEPGQVWTVDRILDLDSEHKIRLASARMVENLDHQPGLEFTFQLLDEPYLISQVKIVDPAGRSQGGGGGGALDSHPDQIREDLFFTNSLPAGELRLEVLSFTLDLQGGWEVSTGE